MDLSRLLLDVLSEELAMKAQGPGQHVTFSKIAVESLMSFIVVSRLRKSICPDPLSTMFQKILTIDRLAKFWEGEYEGGTHDEGSEPPVTAQDSIDARSWNKRISVIEPRINVTSHHRATSVMLHGNFRVAANDLFLFPRGFGTSSSFG